MLHVYTSTCYITLFALTECTIFNEMSVCHTGALCQVSCLGTRLCERVNRFRHGIPGLFRSGFHRSPISKPICHNVFAQYLSITIPSHSTECFTSAVHQVVSPRCGVYFITDHVCHHALLLVYHGAFACMNGSQKVRSFIPRGKPPNARLDIM